MNIFLTNSYFYQLDPKQWRNKTPYPPLATITALAYVKSLGYNPEFHDVSLDSGPADCIQKIEAKKPAVLVIYEDGFNYLTKMCLTSMRDACFELIAAGKKQGAQVIVSSSDATDHFEHYHAQGADIVIHGEGEITLGECLAALETGGSLDNISGISFATANGFTKTNPRSVQRELDLLPDADWQVINLSSYAAIWKQSRFPFTLNISTTRGCPFKCNWCAKPIYGNRYNSRSPERVINEIALLIEQTGATHFWMTDDIFGLKPGWVSRFNALVQEKGLKFHYKIQSRADLLMQEETIAELAASGLQEVWIGAESGSQKILDAMDKGIQVEQIRQSTSRLQALGVRVAYFLQFGYLGETREDIRKTIGMLRQNRPDDIGISVSYPLPGTGFYEKVKHELTNKQNWVDSDDLDMMYQGTFERDFYKRLQRYVHHLFRLQQGADTLKGRASEWHYLLLIPYNYVMSKYLQAQLKW